MQGGYLKTPIFMLDDDDDNFFGGVMPMTSSGVKIAKGFRIEIENSK